MNAYSYLSSSEYNRIPMFCVLLRDPMYVVYSMLHAAHCCRDPLGETVS